jgi:thiamine kinase-like enzyme
MIAIKMKDLINDINKLYLRDCLRKYLKNPSLSLDSICIDVFKANTGDGKQKGFFKVKLNTNDIHLEFILKYLPETDGSIGLSKDKYYREIQFVNSQLYNEINKIIQVPIVATYKNEETNERWILMEEVSYSLKNFGPPTPPTADTLKKVLYKMGQFHSLTWNDNSLIEKYPWLMKFEDFFRGGCKILQSAIEQKSLETWVQSYLDDNPELIESFSEFLNWLNKNERYILKQLIYNPDLILSKLSKSAEAVCHNDLYFPNVGWNNDELLLIDWEFIGVSPTAWDIYNLYSGIPCPDLKEEEAFAVYFNGVEADGLKVDRVSWIKTYRQLNIISILAFELKDLVPRAFSNKSTLPEKKKEFIKSHIRKMVQDVIHTYETLANKSNS